MMYVSVVRSLHEVCLCKILKIPLQHMLYSLTVYVSVVCSIHVVVVCLLYEWIPSQCISLRDVYMSMLYEWILSRKVCCCCVSVIRGDSFPMYVYLYSCCIRSFLYDVCLIYICCMMRFSRNVCLC